MRLQRATRFALYAVLELASHSEGYVSAAEVAAKYGISLNHLAKVMRTLGRSGLVEASRGVGGGYRFVSNPKRTTLLQIIQLFENVDPITAGERQPGDSTEAGVMLKSVLEEIEDTARATLSSISLDTMIKMMRRQRERYPRDTGRRRPATLAP
jgi:Rrf2 family protein